MRINRDLLVLEGEEVKGYNILTQILMKDVGMKTAFKRTWDECPDLDRVSRNAIASAVMKMMSAYLLAQTIDGTMSTVERFEFATKRASIHLAPLEAISHETPKKIVQVSGHARPVANLRGLGIAGKILEGIA